VQGEILAGDTGVTAYGHANGWPCMIVTGSHIPFDRNSIKFNRSQAC
jgi:phosphomannomutase